MKKHPLFLSLKQSNYDQKVFGQVIAKVFNYLVKDEEIDFYVNLLLTLDELQVFPLPSPIKQHIKSLIPYAFNKNNHPTQNLTDPQPPFPKKQPKKHPPTPKKNPNNLNKKNHPLQHNKLPTKKPKTRPFPQKTNPNKTQNLLSSLYTKFFNDLMLFNCLNETLCTWRPFSCRGAPLPFQSHFGRMNCIKIRPFELKYIFSVTLNKLLQYVSLFCGLLPERERVLDFRDCPQLLSKGENAFLSEFSRFPNELAKFAGLEGFELLNRVREERLLKLLSWEVHESEDHWLFTENQKTEFLLEVDAIVFDFLVDEVLLNFLL